MLGLFCLTLGQACLVMGRSGRPVLALLVPVLVHFVDSSLPLEVFFGGGRSLILASLLTQERAIGLHIGHPKLQTKGLENWTQGF